MKKIGIIFGAILCANVAYGETSTINWYMDGSVYDTTTCTVGGDVNLPTTPTKRGYTFYGWGNYIPIEYIETTGTQYIDTGFKPNQDTRVVTEYMIQNSGASFVLFGARNGYGKPGFGLLYVANTQTLRTDYNTDQKSANVPSSFLNTVLTIDKNKNSALIKQDNNVLYNQTNTASNFQVNYNMTVPYWNDEGTVGATPDIQVRVYSFKIYDNGTLVRDMIPVKDLSSVPCMYDNVSGQFFYNAGTGDFVAGPEI